MSIDPEMLDSGESDVRDIQRGNELKVHTGEGLRIRQETEIGSKAILGIDAEEE